MKKLVLIAVSAIVLTNVVQNAHADIQARPKNKHVNLGFGMVTSDLPISEADLRLMITTVNYDYCFMNPMKKFRTSLEIGLYGFYGILPIPELGANLYIGSEDQDIHYKIGVGGFYDISVGGHAGLMVKPGIIIKNRFDVSFFIVPTGLDSEKSYAQFLGLQSKDEAKEEYKKHDNQHVIMPYYGLMFTIRL